MKETRDLKSEWISKKDWLVTLTESDLTLSELRILVACLARINEHKHGKRKVIFKKGEFEKLLGVEKISKNDMRKRIENVWKIIKITNPQNENAFTMMPFFTETRYWASSDGLWEVSFYCNPSLMEFIFSREK